MTPYRVTLTKSAVEEPDGLPLKIHDKIVEHLRQLEQNPRIPGAERLTAIAHLKCAILVPRGQVSHGKLAQSLEYGAMVLEIDGNFDDAMRVVSELAEDKSIYLVNSINPFRLEGQKTVAVELLEQCRWEVPDHVVVPCGNLGNSSALGKGFAELLERGLVDRVRRLSVVQAEGAAPLRAVVCQCESVR